VYRKRKGTVKEVAFEKVSGYSWSPSKEWYRMRLRNWKTGQGRKACRDIEREKKISVRENSKEVSGFRISHRQRLSESCQLSKSTKCWSVNGQVTKSQSPVLTYQFLENIGALLKHSSLEILKRLLQETEVTVATAKPVQKATWGAVILHIDKAVPWNSYKIASKILQPRPRCP
jgi:hypothetical protein